MDVVYINILQTYAVYLKAVCPVLKRFITANQKTKEILIFHLIEYCERN
jgi:hypothetical protein